MIVALDIATKTGYACSDGRHGVIDLTHWRDYAERGEVFRDTLTNLFAEQSSLWIIEQPVVRFHNSYLTCGLVFTAHMVAFNADVERSEVKVTQWRKELLGKGNATKMDAMRWCPAENGYTTISDDEAEAICILQWHECKERE